MPPPCPCARPRPSRTARRGRSRRGRGPRRPRPGSGAPPSPCRPGSPRGLGRSAWRAGSEPPRTLPPRPSPAALREGGTPRCPPRRPRGGRGRRRGACARTFPARTSPRGPPALHCARGTQAARACRSRRPCPSARRSHRRR